jgi:hypothetical protein
VPLYNVACSTLWPQTSNFLKLNNPKATLENKLRGFSALTKGDTIVVRPGAPSDGAAAPSHRTSRSHIPLHAELASSMWPGRGSPLRWGWHSAH